ncbi:MAG: fasciclin domain-containing protein [Cyclobacteriaceae bacterium]
MILKNKNPFRLSVGIMAIAMVIGLCFVTSCSDDKKSDPAPTQSIVAIAQGNANLTSLVSALTRFPDLVTTLSGSGTFTVFAPSNQAFTNLLTAIGQTSLNDVPDAVLKKILQYHVVSTAALKSTQLTAGNVNTVASENIAVTLNPIKLNGTVNVTTADVLATNGVVHIVDAVLVNPSITPIVGTIVAPAYFNKKFTTLIAAVNAASPSTLTALLAATPKKTLFAPTNDAFVAAGITTLPSATVLDGILTYHVLGTEIKAAGLPTATAPANSPVTTLNGTFYLSNPRTAGVFINGTTKVTQTDIAASNGTAHVIDRTLIKPSQTIAAIVTDFTNKTGADKQFTQLLAALNAFPDLLDATKSSTSNITVFAPTDAAFTALYTAQSVADLNALVTKLGSTNVKKVLQHHIINARAFSTDLANGTLGTLNGDNLTVALPATITSAGGVAASLSPGPLNVHATNGVIHVIDKVLLPVL